MKISNQYLLFLVALVILLFGAGRSQSPAADRKTPPVPKDPAASPTKSDDKDDFRLLPPMRVVLGYEQVANASSSSSQRAFIDLYLNSPLREPRVSLWGNIRFSSLPKETLSAATDNEGNLMPIKLFAGTTISNLKDIARTVEFLIGPEILLKKFESSNVSINLIAGGGAITPSSPQESAEFFKIPEDVQKLYPTATSLHPYHGKTVAFVPPDRDRFLRQYFAGLRFKTATDRGVSGGGVFDVAFGQSEAITGGVPTGVIMRLEGFYPLPIPNNQFLYLFGTAMLRMKRAHISDPIILQSASPVALPSNDVPIITTRIDRDFYRIGIGIDLLCLLRGNCKTQQRQRNTSGGAN